LPLKAHSHPHAWIELTTALEFNAAGQAIGLRVGWLFDEVYSLYTLDGQSPSAEVVTALGRETLDNLESYQYFTHVKQGDKAVSFQRVTDYASQFKGARWHLEFLVPFQTPLAVGAADLSYQVFDPTYYVSILHGEGTINQGPSNCQYSLSAPTPSADMQDRAKNLDAFTSAPVSLGHHFAETVRLSCPS